MACRAAAHRWYPLLDGLVLASRYCRTCRFTISKSQGRGTATAEECDEDLSHIIARGRLTCELFFARRGHGSVQDQIEEKWTSGQPVTQEGNTSASNSRHEMMKQREIALRSKST